MQRRQPRTQTSPRARSECALAFFDPQRVAERRPPEWWNQGLVDFLARVAEWIVGKMIIFTLVFLLKIVFMRMRGFLE